MTRIKMVQYEAFEGELFDTEEDCKIYECDLMNCMLSDDMVSITSPMSVIKLTLDMLSTWVGDNGQYEKMFEKLEEALSACESAYEMDNFS